MGIFGKIQHAIFGDTPPWERDILGRAPKPQAPAQPNQAPPAPAQTPAMPQMQAPQPAPAQAAAPAQSQPVDVEQVLQGIAAKKGNPDLDWRHSIVDLMKLLDLDSSLEARKELAEELGYTRPKDGSAEMNLWLHKQVLQKLSANGGKVPADLQQ
jgi:3-oxoacyl-ACP reductase-like protein